MNFLKSLFSEKSEVSMVRVMSLLSLLTAICIAIAGMLKSTPDYSGLSMLCGAFLSAAFFGKVAQKHAESKPKK